MRESGILMPVSSLPGPYGIGCFGKEAFKFVDFLAQAGQKIWQILPLSPTGYGDSPYQSCSAFAGNPYFIDLDALKEEGLLTAAQLKAEKWGTDPKEVDYGTLYVSRFKVLRTAYAAWRKQCTGLHGCSYYFPDDYYAFTLANEEWLDDYALYMALKVANGMKNWVEWDKPYRLRDKKALAAFAAENEKEIGFWKFVQYKFSVQWQAVKTYANKKGVQILGDIPIYVSPDSSDLWTHPELFQTDGAVHLTSVAGCPPDAFAADGQLWGNPLYDYEAMQKDGFEWWIRRIGGAAKLYDVIRIDHFRGFESYWAVPYGETTAKNGRWVKGPGMALVGVLTGWFHDIEFIAEDLGYPTPEVTQLLADSRLPGMKVLEFAFDSREPSNYLPHRYIRNCICYSGTHDNETLAQWLAQTSETARTYAAEYLGLTEQEGYAWGILRSGLASVADTFIAQLQDYLGLGAEARMNTPGTLSDRNWSWRLQPGLLTAELAHRLRRMNTMYERL